MADALPVTKICPATRTFIKFVVPLMPSGTPAVITTSSSRYLSGWITENRAEILVTNGAGTKMVPMRLFTPAQIHLIRLR